MNLIVVSGLMVVLAVAAVGPVLAAVILAIQLNRRARLADGGPNSRQDPR